MLGGLHGAICQLVVYTIMNNLTATECNASMDEFWNKTVNDFRNSLMEHFTDRLLDLLYIHCLMGDEPYHMYGSSPS